MLIWKRLMPPKVRALLALGTLTALVAVTTLQPLPHVWGQDKEAPARKVEQKAEEKAEEAPVKGEVKGEEKAPDKQAEEPAPVKKEEVKQEGRGEKTEKEPMKEEEETLEKTPTKEEGRGPRKTEGKEPMQEEGDVPRKVEGKGPMKEEGENPEGRPVPRKGDPENPKDPVPGRGRGRPVPEKEEPQGGGEQLPKVAFEYDARASSPCGEGKLCFNFKLPTMKDLKGDMIAATGVISVTLIQNAQPMITLESPQLNEKSGGRYCFQIDPTQLGDLDPALGGFDFMATAVLEWQDGQWADGITPSSTATVGTRREGINRGLHNDYQFVCKDMPSGGPIVGFNGGISFDAKNSSTCGKGQICYNYALPTVKTPAGIVTGTLVITLNIYQNGNTTPLVFTPPTLMQSGVLKDGDHYCFDVNPTTFPGIDLTAGGFDFVASAKFSLNGSDSTFLVGSVPQGVILNKNNDYRIECEPGTGTKGEIVYDARTSTTCGRGKICFNLKLPTMKDPKGNVITATGVIHLTLYQNGQPVLSLPASPVLNDKTGTRYCFPIDPANIKHLNCDLGGFDFVATANFSFNMAGTPDTKATVGTDPTGIIAEVNNDYQCVCVEDPGPGTGHEEKVGCCLGKENVVYTEDFQHAQEIESEYQRLDSLEQHLVPGTYVVTDVKYIDKACRSWKLPAACLKTHDFSGNVLVVNGLTNQKPPAPATAVIWSHKFELPSLAGVKEAEYRVCFRYLPLPQCCFDIPARPHAVVEGADGPLTVNSDSDSETGCGRLYVATFHAVPGSTIKLEILLDGNGMGDGNDLLIDNISVAQIVKVPSNLLTFSPDATEVVNGTFDVTSVIANGLASPCTWDWELYQGNGVNPALFTLVQPSTQSNQPTSTFTSLAEKDGNGQVIMYWVKLTVHCDCSKGAVYRPASQIITLRTLKLEGKSIDDPHPQRAKRGKAAPATAPVQRSE